VSYEGFTLPSWDAPVDVAAHVHATPAGATIKGLFATAIVEACEAAGTHPKHAYARYVPFTDYPMRDYIPLLAEAARILHPRLSVRIGLRKIGRASQPTFARSMVGKVIFGTIHDVPSAIEAIVKAYRVATPSSTVELRSLTEGRAVIHLGGMTTFLDSHHVGLLEGVTRAAGTQAQISVKPSSLSSCDFLVEWHGGDRYEKPSSIM
jgi:uncharacterized protein (TIGR02265 family)